MYFYEMKLCLFQNTQSQRVFPGGVWHQQGHLGSIRFFARREIVPSTIQYSHGETIYFITVGKYSICLTQAYNQENWKLRR